MKKLVLLLAFSPFLFMQCKVVKYTSDKLPDRQLIIGTGGGFTGIETSYTLLDNGQIFKQVGVEGALEELSSIKPKAAKALFEKLKGLQLYKLDIEQPGNLYYFLREVNETLDSKVTWGAGDYLPPESLVGFYKEVKALVYEKEVVKQKKQQQQKPQKKKEDEKKKETDW